MCIKLYNVFLLNQSVRVSLFCTNCTLHLCNTVIFLQTHFWLKNMGCRPHAHSFENTLHFTFFYNTVTQLCQSTKIWYSPPVKNSLLLLWGLNQAFMLLPIMITHPVIAVFEYLTITITLITLVHRL